LLAFQVTVKILIGVLLRTRSPRKRDERKKY
jgi:hypothetical protein